MPERSEARSTVQRGEPEPRARRTHQSLRATRDCLIDFLGFAETFPLQDLVLCPAVLTVPFGSVARAQIEAAQPDCEARLHDRHRQLLDPPSPWVTARAGAQKIDLVTEPIAEDTTRTVLVRTTTSGREAFLQATLEVKVGLDTGLAARILAPPLVTTALAVADTEPRLVEFGESVEVEVDATQEGVDYQLIARVDGEEIPLSASRSGTLRTLRLRSEPLFEDIELQVRATKVFEPATERAPETALLEAVLPLAVGPQQQLSARVETPIVPWGGAASVKVEATQASARYRLWRRPLTDPEVVRETPTEHPVPSDSVLSVPVPGQPTFRVFDPTAREGPSLQGYTPVGPAHQGTGGALHLPLGPCEDDVLVVVEVLKTHPAGLADPTASTWPEPAVVSTRRSATVGMVLVRPNPNANPELSVFLEWSTTGTQATAEVHGGETGVFYDLQGREGRSLFRTPAYVHRAALGLGRQWVGDDLVVAGDPSPWPSVVEIDMVEFDGEVPLEALQLEARKARTRVAVDLPVADLPALPKIRPERDRLKPGETARIVVVASQPGDRYELLLAGRPVKKARQGNGEDLVFLSQPLDTDTTFTLEVRRPADPGVPVVRRVVVPVRVEADATD